MSRPPMFDQGSLAKIRSAQNPSEVVDVRDTDWLLKVVRDRSDIGVAVGTRIVVRRQNAAQAGELVVAVVGGEHVLRRVPVTDGPIAGLVVGLVVEVA